MPLAAEVSMTPTDTLARIGEVLDLSNIRFKLSDPEEGKGYSQERLDLMESEYRKFLALQAAFPGADIVPCGLVDEMWHWHILDTAAFERTAMRYSGSSSTTSRISGCVERTMRRR